MPPGQLTLLADLGVTKTHRHLHVSNDNPFSESHFKTPKYQSRFPKCFGCIEDAKQFCREFFAWYNDAHHHAGLGLTTPHQMHYGQTDAIHAARQITLNVAFAAHPERFVKTPPAPPQKPTAVWIRPNPKQSPDDKPKISKKLSQCR